ncbi:glycoside hydrolase family 78 protein [Streptomyces sp. NBC_00341]|uniref:family 78 glycoside hydrolase catalytic domain n=1 Tax=Streptomyces sp. NBC_00341 TaxID=2975717 RepID=UPI00308FEAEB|nr:glycoside hydrolase family 78 protein [Streptomyces sp. NBC_00341]
MNEPATAPAEAHEPLRPLALTTERRTGPIGLDEAAPLFGWRLAATGRGRAQSAYRLRVEDDARDSVWDSGWQRSERTADIPYEGSALVPCTRYSWRVRVADEEGARSGWSEPAFFETGLAPGLPDATEAFDAEWITAPGEEGWAPLPDLDTVDGEHDLYRIRAVGGQDVLVTVFRARFAARAGAVPAAARLLVAAPGTVDATVNGVRVPHDGLPSPALAAALAEHHGGGHVLAVRVSGDGFEPPHLLAALTDGTPRTRPGPAVPHAVASDDSWRARGFPHEAQVPDDWAAPAFDDGDDRVWPRALAVGRNGDAPHGRAPGSYRPSPFLRQDFTLRAGVRRARLYATSLGIHELRLNGARVGDEELAPGWTDYDHRVAYRTHDVTGLLRTGPNTWGAVLADGWYAGNLCIFGKQHYGSARALRALLVVEHTDGSTTRLRTTADGSWRASDGPVRYADLQNGEVYDARREAPGWDTPDFDAGAWHPAVAAAAPEGLRVLASLAPPVRAQRELPPVRQETRGTATLADFGENVSGRVRIGVRGPAGTRVLLRHAEALRHDGALYTDNLRTARATDEYVLRGTPEGEVWEPRFTTHGFRYCEISVLPPEAGGGKGAEDRETRTRTVSRAPRHLPGGGTAQLTSVTAVALWADMPATGSFACSHEGLTTLHHNIRRSLEGNFLSVPTDCPQRDERMGWTGDIQVFAPTAAFHYDIRGFLRGWLRELRGAQHPDGGVPHTVPDMFRRAAPEEERAGAAGAAGWGDAAVTVPAALLERYADRRGAREALESVADWLDYLAAHSEDGLRPADAWGDWLALSDTPKDLVATAYYAHAARTAAYLAAALGETEREREWTRAYERVRTAFRERWVGGGGVLHPPTQTAYVLALHLGLLDAHEVRSAADRLADEVAARGFHLTTGFLGTPWLLDALTDAGRADVAHRLLLQDTYPSWLYPVSTGATTIWERWNSWSDSTGFADASMTSFNHYAYGAVGDWIYRNVGGLAPVADGYRRALVAPRPPEGLTWATTSLRTDDGTITVDWRREKEAWDLSITLPPGVTAEVRLPALPGAAGRITESGRPLAEAPGVRVLDGPAEYAAVAAISSGSYRFTMA